MVHPESRATCIDRPTIDAQRVLARVHFERMRKELPKESQDTKKPVVDRAKDNVEFLRSIVADNNDLGMYLFRAMASVEIYAGDGFWDEDGFAIERNRLSIERNHGITQVVVIPRYGHVFDKNDPDYSREQNVYLVTPNLIGRLAQKQELTELIKKIGTMTKRQILTSIIAGLS